MGAITELIHDEIIPSESDRHSNLLRIYKKDNGEVVIHFRNFKINLITPEEIQEWKFGMEMALAQLQKDNNGILENDI